MASFGQMPVVEEQQRYARGLATREDNDSHYDEARRSRTVQRYARMHVQKLTLGQMVAYGRDMTEGKLIKSARHLHRELPVRLAQRIVDFQSQPYAVISNPYFKQVFRMYHDAFDRFRSFPNITNMEEERRFTKLVETMVAEHISVIPILGKGLAEVRGYSSVESDFMDRLLMTRISRRVLAEQHIALHKALHKAKLRRTSTMTASPEIWPFPPLGSSHGLSRRSGASSTASVRQLAPEGMATAEGRTDGRDYQTLGAQDDAI